MGDNKIEQIMETAMNRLRSLVDVSAVIGTPQYIGENSIVIPFSKVSLGFVAGGGEYGEKNKTDTPFAGGSGGGLSVTPIGFIVVDKGKVKVINMEDKSAFLKMLEDLPSMVKAVIEKMGDLQEDKQ